ncbi:MAG: Mov34/MPN/PAD-1 family protein [Archaeoglobaceae archaeon]|nr:Mov34/MPN/PAD-1 family protein [Archaeoglobaceae archaeon]MCX8151786.1 Mov34/MPN/PAD-1 family protein [Archaeoglobaceae archaeon]MDW8013189.1 Mov34/MPN/PAD-1 family protein [Archaeoglobaceae archaeon]
MKIKREVIKALLEIAKNYHPSEFIALLGGKRDEISEIIFLPFISGNLSALINLDVLPIGISVLGTVHSHPSPSCEPSEEDLELFSRFGKYHIIVCYPYRENCWKCYDRKGAEVKPEVV